MMELRQTATHLSLAPTFQSNIKLPDITVLTGTNGSGKSHLLDGLCPLPPVISMMMPFEQPPANSRPFQLFDATGTLVEHIAHYRLSDFFQQTIGHPGHTSDPQPLQYATQWSNYKHFLQLGFEFTQSRSNEFNGIGSFIDPMQIAPSDADWTNFFENQNGDTRSRKEAFRSQWKSNLAELRAQQPTHNQHPQNNNDHDRIRAAWAPIATVVGHITSTGKDILDLKPADFLLYAARQIRQRLQHSKFADQLSLFGQLETIGRELINLQQHDLTGPVEHGESAKPWDIINSLLTEWDIPLRAKEVTRGKFGLAKEGTHTIAVDHLSSGEAVLIGLVFLIYSERIGESKTPEVLLLDELDAPLHPARIKHLFKVITHLAEHHKTKTILVTHSPTTVALAPVDVIAVLRHPIGKAPTLELVSKDRALSELTVGVPTLAISYDGRRQVFCENDFDCGIYTTLYEGLKSRLETDRSLQFIGTGMKSKFGDINTGCDVVKRLVAELTKNGVGSAFGLVDSDGRKNEVKGRIFVGANSQRDGIENLVLDPLLLAGLIVDRLEKCRSKIGVPSHTSMKAFSSWSPMKLQKVVDAIQTCVLGEAAKGPTTSVAYCGGFNLDILDAYLWCDDHILAEKVITAFEFRPITTKSDLPAAQIRLMEEIVIRTAREFPEFIPTDLVRTFQNILEFEVSDSL